MALFKYILKIIAAIILMAVLLVWLCSWISPEKFPVAGIAYLAFPYLGFMSLVVLVIFLILFPRRKILLLTGIVFISYQLLYFTGLRLSSILPPDCDDNNLSLLSYNVNNFGLFDWDNRVGVRDSIMDYIETVQPDIICFQDFYTRHDRDSLDNIFLLQNNLGYEYYFFSPTLTNKVGHQWGLATFSKFPITETDFKDFSGSYTGANTNGVQIVTVNQDGNVFSVINYHLESYHLGRHYNLEKTEKTYSLKWWFRNLPDIIQFMLPSMQNKTRQTNLISEIIGETDLPVIVAGDMNNIAGSYFYRRMHAGLQDTAYGSRTVVPVTLNGFPPFFRIDFVGVSQHWETCHYQVSPIIYSNHFPVFVKLNLKH